jgi:3-methyladenine DNA glycosylase AlkD
MDVEATVAELEASLTRQGTRARAEQEKRYLKSELRFLGVPVPVVRREVKAFVRSHPGLDRATLRALVDRLWATGVHELRSMAVGILEARSALLRPADAPWLVSMARSAGTWAHVDWLAVKVLGALIVREPGVARKLDGWAKDDSFWVRRTALLALHDPLNAGEGDFEHFARMAVPMLGEREFFIRKAIGWVLRATARRTPARTVAFVERHAAEMSGLTFQEATRLLPEVQQRRLRALRDRG